MEKHPVVVVLAVLASIATIGSFLIALGAVDFPNIGGVRGGGSCSEPRLSLSDGSAPSGTTVTVSGSGFPADDRVEMRFHTESLTPAETDGSGRFQVDVRIPGSFDPFAPQQFDIGATTTGQLCFASTPFQLTGG